MDTANTESFLGGDLHVALFTPAGRPGVLDEPVVGASRDTVADGEHGVVDVDTAGSCIGEDTRLVGLEVSGLGID